MRSGQRLKKCITFNPFQHEQVGNSHPSTFVFNCYTWDMLKNKILLIGMGGDDDINVDDPYRIIIFDDIQTFLYDVTFPQSCIELLYACFSFVGLTFNPGYSSSNPLITDTFLNNKLANELIADKSFWIT